MLAVHVSSPKQGSREEVFIMPEKKEKIDSHLGLKVRKSSKQKKHEEQLCRWESSRPSMSSSSSSTPP